MNLKCFFGGHDYALRETVATEEVIEKDFVLAAEKYTCRRCGCYAERTVSVIDPKQFPGGVDEWLNVPNTFRGGAKEWLKTQRK